MVEWDIYAGAKDGRLALAKHDTITTMDTLFYNLRGLKTYEIKDYLGTPRLTFSDVKTPVDATALFPLLWRGLGRGRNQGINNAIYFKRKRKLQIPY